ncbi:MAG: MarR family transcriptional regulator [Eggerthellaceae bacterium]|nr:MarR family transcriptional regulator [Eggerthellaceae bacterium]
MKETDQDIHAEVYFAIVNSEISLWSAIDARFKEAGVPVAMARYALLRILACKPMRLQELAARCHSGESATSRIIDRMRKDGLVEKQADKSDGRAVLLRLTDVGQRIEAQATAVFNAALKDLFDQHSEAELQKLLTLLAPFCSPERPNQ